MSNNFNIQVDKNHYLNSYDSSPVKFVYYYTQISLSKNLKPANILEIGVGNKTYYNYMKEHNYNISSCDFDKALNPDFVADIRKLPFEDNSYELITACEVLEHISFVDVSKALDELHRVTKKYIILAIPYRSPTIEFTFRFPFVGMIFKKSFVNFFWRIPFPTKDLNFEKEHYWEIGTRSYPLKRILKLFKKKGFRINNIQSPVLDATNYFFVLEKK
jgi:hypothetical protein